MKVQSCITLLLAVLSLTLTACSKPESATVAPPKPAAPAPVTDPMTALSTQGKGFTVGALMAANPVYVMFDPQCPHCGHLWEAAKPLHNKVKFIWMPVAIINAKSAPQGAALLSAANPLELMSTHEASILTNQGGIAASADAPAEIAAAIKKNTQVFTSLGIDSVPYIVAKNLRTSQVVTKTGALSTADLADFVGVDRPAP